MEVEIVHKHDNVLLKRTDVRFKVTHPKEKTPQRQAVRDKIAAAVGKPTSGVIIDYMRSHFGLASTEGFAKCYASADEAKKMEPQFLLKRHGLVEAKKEGEKKEEAAKAPPPPPPKAAEKPAEKKEAPKPAEKPAEKKEAPKPAEKPAEKKEAPKPAEKKDEKKPAEKK